MARLGPPVVGEPAPMFVAASELNARFALASLGGQWIVLLLFGSLADPIGAAAHAAVLARRGAFDDRTARFFGVGADPQDRGLRGLRNALPGLRYFWDDDGAVHRLYGAVDAGAIRPLAVLIDPSMRVVAVETAEEIDRLLDTLDRLKAAEAGFWAGLNAPVLTLPRVFEPAFCRRLIAYCDDVGAEPSGFMDEEDGLTRRLFDDQHKRRRDALIHDPDLLQAARARLNRRLVPAIEQAFGWSATRIERYVIGRYAADEGGFFNPHRDNAAAGVAHRTFAVTLNLNADDYEGGELRFPEFGPRTYKPPTGGATVFACGLLHEATPVTRGVRYAFLPFLYDEAGAQLRARNRAKVAPG